MNFFQTSPLNEDNDEENDGFAGFTGSNNYLQSPGFLNQNNNISGQAFSGRSPYDSTADQYAQSPLPLNQQQNNTGFTNQEFQTTSANVASGSNHNPQRNLQTQNMGQAQIQMQNRLIQYEAYIKFLHQMRVDFIKRNMANYPRPSKDNQEEEVMNKKIIREGPNYRPWEELKPVQVPTMPTNLMVYPMRPQENFPAIPEGASLESLVDSNNRNTEANNANSAERRQDPLETCFKVKTEDKTLTLMSHKNKKDNFQAWENLNEVNKVVLQFPFFKLKDNKLLQDLQIFFGWVGQLEKISIDFRYLKYDSSLRAQYEERLDQILQTSFGGQQSLKNIQVFWIRPEGAEIVVQHILKQLLFPIPHLKHLRLDLEGAQLPYARFQELIQHVQGLEKSFNTLKLSADVVSPEAAPIVPREFIMPQVKEFALCITCLGPFGEDLIQFISTSVSTMENVESLELKLIIKDFTGPDTPESYIERLFGKIQSVSNNLQELKVIISLERKDEPQDEGVKFEKLIRLVVNKFVPRKIKEFAIGTNPDNAKLIKTKKEIEKFWREKKNQESDSN